MFNFRNTMFSRVSAGLLALIMFFSLIPMGLFTEEYMADTIITYTVTLKEDGNVSDLSDVDITLTNSTESTDTQTVATQNGVATFADFVDTTKTYILTVEEISGYDPIVIADAITPSADTPNFDVELTKTVVVAPENTIKFERTSDGNVNFLEATSAIITAGKVEIDSTATDTLTFTVTPEIGFKVSKVEVTKNDETPVEQLLPGAGQAYSSGDTFVTTNGEKYTVTIEFAENKPVVTDYKITINSGALIDPVIGTVSSDESISAGGKATITITPASGYNVASVLVDGTEVIGNAGLTDITYSADADKAVYTLEIANITADKAVDVAFSEIVNAQEPFENLISISAEGKVKEDGSKFYYKNDAVPEITLTDAAKTVYESIRINDTLTGTFTNTTVITKIEAYHTAEMKWYAVALAEPIHIIIDKDAPEVTLTQAEYGWLKADKVTITGSVTETESGVAKVVWSKDVELADAAVLSETANVATLTDGNFSFDSAEGDQNSKYFVYAVDNANNVSAKKEVSVKIDNTAPTITNFQYSIEEGSIVDNVISFLTTGTMYNNTMYVLVTADDSRDFSGVASITLYKDGQVLETKTVTVGNTSVVFVLEKENFATGAELSVVATDILGNTSAVAIKPTEVNNTILSNKVILNSTPATVAVIPEQAEYTDANGRLWYCSDVDVTVKASDMITGIKTITVTLNGNPITTDINGNDFNAGLTSPKEFVVNIPDLVEGKNTLQVVVTNNAGVESDPVVQEVFIDKTKPTIEKFEITKKENSTIQDLINFLTFGTFFKEEVTVTVTAADAAGTGAGASAGVGVKEITLYQNNILNGNAEPEVIETKIADANGKCSFLVPKDLVINQGGELCLTVSLSATATDILGNTVAKENATPMSTTNSNLKHTGLMIETKKPTADISVSDPSSPYVVNNGKDWYTVNTIFTVDVADENSGIQKVTITINDEVKVEETLSENQIFSKKYENISTENCAAKADGSYLFKVVVTDNAGNETITTKTVYKDTEKPFIASFDFEPLRYVEASETDVSEVLITNYGFYFKEDTRVTVWAKDGDASSGIKSITYYTEDITDGKSSEVTLDANAEGKVSFVINKNFKGQIYAKSVDNVDFAEDTYKTPNSAIVEKQDKHDEENHILMEKADAPYKNAANEDLYVAEVPVDVTVIDTYSGIREIEWSITVTDNTSQNKSGKVTIDNTGNATSGGDSGWTLVDKEENLVTKMKKTILVDGSSNDIVLKVKMMDRAGNTSEKSIEVNIDKTKPVIEVSFDNNTSDAGFADVFNARRGATIKITERNFNSKDVVVQVTSSDGSVPVLSAWTEHKDNARPGAVYYTATMEFAGNSDYTLDVSYTDMAKHAADDIAQSKFTIDTIAPTITVSYDNTTAMNEKYYSADRVATVTITEHNFDASRVTVNGTATDNGVTIGFPSTSGWSSSGDNHSTTIYYNSDGHYTFDIEVSDKAGNTMADYSGEDFYIDKTIPTIEFSGVEDLSANNGTVAPVITLNDTNYDRNNVTVTLTGANHGAVNYSRSTTDIANGQTINFADFEHIQDVDDIYTLDVLIVDMAGNEFTDTISFSANRFGSVYVFDDTLKEIEGKYVQTEQDVVFTETNVDSIDRESIQIKLARNGAPRDLVEGTDYTVSSSGGNGQWTQLRYIINKALFVDEGRYDLTIYSVDAAGNINENNEESKKAEISFGVDKTAPVIIPIDFESGMQYDVEGKTVEAEIKDNLVLQNVTILLNDEAVEFDANGEIYSFFVPESSKEQKVSFIATDAAGNVYELLVENVLITTNAFARFVNNTPLVVGSVAVAVGIPSAGAGIFVFRRKRML